MNLQTSHNNKSLKALKCTLIFLCIFSLLGCASLLQNKKNDLDYAIERYNRALRWGAIRQALEYVPAEKRVVFMNRADKIYSQLSIADFELEMVDPDKDVKRATVLVHFKFYWKDSLSLLDLRQEQHWEKIQNHWYVIDPDLSAFLKKR